MVIVAIAGGTSPGLGRSILCALQKHPDHTPIVLSRQFSTTPKWLEDMSIEVRRVDYESQESLVTALKDVHTVRSFTSIGHVAHCDEWVRNLNGKSRSYVPSSPQTPHGYQFSCLYSRPLSQLASNASRLQNSAVGLLPSHQSPC